MKKFILILLTTCSFYSINAQHYAFYLHGRIVETMGANAVDTINGFGPYQYQAILDSLKARGFDVKSEVRPKNTDEKEYAKKVVSEINDLISKGVNPSHITVIGASKGAAIAMNVSFLAANKQLNFVLMGACSTNNYERYPDLQLYGNVLSIYEKSDSFGSCEEFKNRSKSLSSYKEVALNTGLRHGFIYRPLPAWLRPAAEWGFQSH